MAITIDYTQDTYYGYVIEIPKADLTLISSSPIEVRQLNINDLRLWLHDLQDDEAGMWAIKAFDNTAPKPVASIVLARVLELTDAYRVLFENGTYNVNIVGGNSNLDSRQIKNSVGVNTANSAGLIDDDLTALKNLLYPLYGI